MTARALVALNLGALFGYFVWRSVRSDGLEAQTLTLAQYTARFEGYRDHLLVSARAPMAGHVVLCAILALGAALLYELLSRGLAAIMSRSRVGSIFGVSQQVPRQ